MDGRTRKRKTTRRERGRQNETEQKKEKEGSEQKEEEKNVEEGKMTSRSCYAMSWDVGENKSSKITDDMEKYTAST